MINVNGLKVDKIYIGDVKVDKIYSGDTLIYAGKNPLRVKGIIAPDKVYDGTIFVNVNSNSIILDGLIDGDDVNITVAATGTMANKRVGNDKAVTIAATESGADIDDYEITYDEVKVNVTPKTLTLNGIAAVNRYYDGSNKVEINTDNMTISGLIQGDDVFISVGHVGTIADANVGHGKFVTLTITAYEIDIGNYIIAYSVRVDIWAI
jgi:hypothetical protein